VPAFTTPLAGAMRAMMAVSLILSLTGSSTSLLLSSSSLSSSPSSSSSSAAAAVLLALLVLPLLLLVKQSEGPFFPLALSELQFGILGK